MNLVMSQLQSWLRLGGILGWLVSDTWTRCARWWGNLPRILHVSRPCGLPFGHKSMGPLELTATLRRSLTHWIFKIKVRQDVLFWEILHVRCYRLLTAVGSYLGSCWILEELTHDFKYSLHRKLENAGKGHGKSWNFKMFKGYEPWLPR